MRSQVKRASEGLNDAFYRGYIKTSYPTLESVSSFDIGNVINVALVKTKELKSKCQRLR